MKVTITTDKITREQLLKRIFFMLYNACGGPLGMGVLQARDDVTEDDVWNNVTIGADYPGDRGQKEFASGRIYGDYVFGRMIKWGVELFENKNSFLMREGEFRADYQGFARVYPNNEAIISAAMKEFKIEDGYTTETSS